MMLIGAGDGLAHWPQVYLIFARSADGAYSPFWPLVVDGGMPMAW